MQPSMYPQKQPEQRINTSTVQPYPTLPYPYWSTVHYCFIRLLVQYVLILPVIIP